MASTEQREPCLPGDSLGQTSPIAQSLLLFVFDAIGQVCGPTL